MLIMVIAYQGIFSTFNPISITLGATSLMSLLLIFLLVRQHLRKTTRYRGNMFTIAILIFQIGFISAFMFNLFESETLFDWMYFATMIAGIIGTIFEFRNNPLIALMMGLITLLLLSFLPFFLIFTYM
ncbi:hypothetical protein SAMN04488134_102336 [Amphibacillus marinus]|uniref:Uncharacterized protein n=1 Tax=Amphibacillus marinus TaxID=872970 RepID=A0A1H8KML9_9BACI|nr:hypothetical protein [Amphibacillus marinus]SEN93961.1 hypothetical protein SAMN04488134_102336 [Amphibacillus marinus]